MNKLILITAFSGLSAVSSAQAGIFITEFFYQSLSNGGGAEFVELTNVSFAPIDMTGWSFDDDARGPEQDPAVAGFDLSGFGVVAAGESVIISELSAEDFRTEWNLPSSLKVIGNLGNPDGNNLGRNDEINIYDADGNLVDRLTYGDQDFDGSERFRRITAVTDPENYGQNDIFAWRFSEVGVDGAFESVGGDIGSPGVAPIPEPSGALLLVSSVAGGLLIRRKRA